MSARASRWLKFGAVALVSAELAIGGWIWFKLNEIGDTQALSAFHTSDLLRETVIVPTLDCPIPEGKSVIWCASFQLAWNHLKDDVVKEPILLADAQASADRLNRADQSESDVDPKAVFAAAGLVKDGIVKRIQAEMAAKFPRVPTPSFDVPPTGAVAYAYLAASAKYEYPFFENDKPFFFSDSASKGTSVRSFGIRAKDEYAYRQLRSQVRILYNGNTQESKATKFIVDPCHTSEPYQIVLARIDRKPTLAETLADVQQKIAALEGAFQLSDLDTLLVPNVAVKISHRFKELEGKHFMNPALPDAELTVASQTIQFRLDRGGAELASEDKIEAKPFAYKYHVDRPFLVYMKKRTGSQPFFVAWIENVELLEKK